MKNSRSLRLISFGIGLIAVVALTGMNIYSLYELRDNTIQTARDNKKDQIEEFTYQVRHRFFRPFRGIRLLDTEYLREYYEEHRSFPKNFRDVLSAASQDSIFSRIYYSPQQEDHCLDPRQPIFEFRPELEDFLQIDGVPEPVCNGLGLARSRMKVLINDYRWNNKVTFDTHRSMTLSIIDLTRREVTGHLIFIIDRDYLVNDYLSRKLAEQFGPADQTSMVVWLRDFMNEETLASSDPLQEYSRDRVDLRQRFPELLDNWVLYAGILSPPALASGASITGNLIVLGFAVLTLFGAFLFMYITAKRERELAQRQAGFLANVTHELKTPLAAMQAAGENLADGRVTETDRIRTYGEHIYKQTLRLGEMIDRLLDVARTDSEVKIASGSGPVPLQELLRSYYETHRTFVTSKGFEFKLEIEPDLPPVSISRDDFFTILGNLVDNALKYSRDEKQISIALRGTPGHVVLSVSDRGIGIPKEAHRRIFEKFYRLEDSMTAKTKGHGLGLSIVRTRVESAGGTISVESNHSGGTTFTIRFPAAGKPAAVTEEKRETEKLHAPAYAE